MTWVHNKYFHGELNDAREISLSNTKQYRHIDVRPKYIVNGDAQWELTMQLIEPQFNITTFWSARSSDLNLNTKICVLQLVNIAFFYFFSAPILYFASIFFASSLCGNSLSNASVASRPA